MSQRSQVSRVALCMSKVKVPIELFWTAKNRKVWEVFRKGQPPLPLLKILCLFYPSPHKTRRLHVREQKPLSGVNVGKVWKNMRSMQNIKSLQIMKRMVVNNGFSEWRTPTGAEGRSAVYPLNLLWWRFWCWWQCWWWWFILELSVWQWINLSDGEVASPTSAKRGIKSLPIKSVSSRRFT